MGKVILCVDNGNQKLKEAVLYLEGQGCKVYRSSAMDEQTLSRVFAEIEENEGRLDGLLLSVNEGLKDIFTGNVEQAAREDKEYCGKTDLC